MPRDFFKEHYTTKALDMIERTAFIKDFIYKNTKNDSYKKDYYYYEESFTISYIIALLTTENELKRFLEVDGYNLEKIGEYFEIENFEKKITEELEKHIFLENEYPCLEQDRYQISPVLINVYNQLESEKINYDEILLGIYYTINLLSYGQEMEILKKEDPKMFTETYTYKKITGAFKDNPLIEKHIELYALSHERPPIQLPIIRKGHHKHVKKLTPQNNIKEKK